MRLDIINQMSDYRGVLGWNAVSPLPAFEVPLFIKDHPIPMRKPKITEINTVSLYDPGSGAESGTSMIFMGAPDILQVAISGWIITPRVGSAWQVKDLVGTNYTAGGNITYTELISRFIQGYMNVENTFGMWKRRDPDYYVTPYGQQYLSPVIAQFDFGFTTNPSKQTFNMTLYLET